VSVRVLIDTNAYAALLYGDERVALELDRAEAVLLSPIVIGIFQRMEHGARLLTFDRHFEGIERAILARGIVVIHDAPDLRSGLGVARLPWRARGSVL